MKQMNGKTNSAGVATDGISAYSPSIKQYFNSFLADRCNATFGYCHNMSSVSRLSVRDASVL